MIKTKDDLNKAIEVEKKLYGGGKSTCFRSIVPRDKC